VPRGQPAQPQAARAAAGDCEVESVQSLPYRVSWARLLKRLFDIDMQICPNCGGSEFKIIASALARPVIEKVLDHLGVGPQLPPKGRAREPGPGFAA